MTIYLDSLSTTRVDARVVEKLLPYFRDAYGNASSRHEMGRRASRAVEDARSEVARLVGARESDEIVFTSGATEANNLAILGLFEESGGHLVTSSVEHASVSSCARALEKRGVEVTWLPVDSSGLVRPEALADAMRDETVLVSVMFANNVVGTIQRVVELGEIVRSRGGLFHSDAAQAAGKIPVDVDAAKIDLLSSSAHKLHGPKGVGALVIGERARPRLRPRALGGSQERGLRSGTLDVPSIVGMGESARIARIEGLESAARMAETRDHLEGILDDVPGAHLVRPPSRLPHVVFVAFEGVDAELLIAALPEIAFSRGSACTADLSKPSHVLVAMQASPEVLHGGVRFGLTKDTTIEEVEEAGRLIAERVRVLRAL